MSLSRVYVGGYHYGATHGDIMNLFYSYNIHRITMKSAYYCFVEFESISEAKKAVRIMNGRTWMYGWKIRVEMARSPPNSVSTEKIETESEPDIEKDSALMADSSIFKCEYCYHLFNLTNYRPRSLPCGHTLCSHCVKVKFRVRPTCPFCKTFCGIGKTTPSDYPNNYFILKLLDNDIKVSPVSKKRCDPDYENSKQLELNQTINNIYSCNDYLIDLKDYKRKKESKLKALQEDISYVNKSIDEGEIILNKLRKVQNDIESAEEEVSLTLVTSEAQLFFQEFMEWTKVALDKIQNNESFTSKLENKSSKSPFSNSALHRNDMAMLEFLAPTVDSDDEREVVTVGNDQDASDTIFSVNSKTIACENTEHQVDCNSNSSDTNLSSISSAVSAVIEADTEYQIDSYCNKSSIYESSSSSSSSSGDHQSDRFENDQVVISSTSGEETDVWQSSQRNIINSNNNSSRSHPNWDLNPTQTDLSNLLGSFHLPEFMRFFRE